MLKTEKLKLVSEWDKTFPQSEKVDHKKVTFVNRYGITLAADLYKPKNASGKYPPFYTDCGRNIHIGKNVFINAGCKFQDQGGIYIEDGVLIGHNAGLCAQIRASSLAGGMPVW